MVKEPKARILVTDDDENIRKVVASILKDKGYAVDLAETGAEAIAKTASGQYDLMLIDIRLPDMEGTELLTKVHDTNPKMKKIIVTGFPTLHNAITAVNRGADAYIMKPFDVEKMLETVAQQLEKQKQERMFNEAGVAEFIESRVLELGTQDQQAQN